MNDIKVKICGIRDIESAKTAIFYGADFLGFNFVPSSKRSLRLEQAKKIIDELRITKHELRTKFVGIFQNQPVEEVNEIADFLDLDFVQLHGEEDKKYMGKIKRKVIKKIDERDPSTSFHFAQDDKTPFFILDRQVQGNGAMVDFNKAKKVAKQFALFYSGGLTPENVAGVISTVSPFAVDVAGGIETDGKQDLQKIRDFVKNAKGVTV